MGNKISKTDPRISNRPHFVGEQATFDYCTNRRMNMIEEKRRQPTRESTEEEEDLIFELRYETIRERKSFCSKIRFGLNYFFCDVCPIFCCPPTPAAIIHKLAFRPPERSTYDIVQFGESGYRLHLRSKAAKYLTRRYRRCQAYTPQLRYFFIQRKSSSNRIACVYVQSSMIEASSLTLLYSHNNETDLGLSIGYIVLLSRRYRINVFAYDYAGYGQSTGSCSESQLYQSGEDAYDYLTQDLGVPGDQIVAVGTSLGTAATIHLAASDRPLKGVILEGGFLSALRVLCPARRRTCQLDRFVSVEKIRLVKVPTLVVHGRKDKLFSLTHAKTLRRLCPGAQNIEPIFIDDCGHIDFGDFTVYWLRLHSFLHYELTNTAQVGPCCTYHPKEILIRNIMRLKKCQKID